MSERRACGVVGLERSSYRSCSTTKDQTALRMRIRDLAAARVHYGYRCVHVLPAREGWKVNHKCVYRLYRLEGLSLRHKVRKKRVRAPRLVQPAPTAPNQHWRMDFMSDSLHYDRFRVFTFVDTMTRESPYIAVERSFFGRHIAELRDEVGERIGLPKAIQLYKGPEFTSKVLDEWTARNQVKLLFSRPQHQRTIRISKHATGDYELNVSTSTGLRRWKTLGTRLKLGIPTIPPSAHIWRPTWHRLSTECAWRKSMFYPKAANSPGGLVKGC